VGPIRQVEQELGHISEAGGNVDVVDDVKQKGVY